MVLKFNVKPGCDPGYIGDPAEDGSCSPCANGTYAVNAIECVSCGQNAHTDGRPGTSIDDCSKYPFLTYLVQYRNVLWPFK